MKKKKSIPPLEMVNILDKYDPHIWEKLVDENGNTNSLFCKDYADKHFPDTSGILFALSEWRKHKQIYEFSAELVNILKDIDTLDDDIPCEALLHLPYNGIFIQVPDGMLTVDYSKIKAGEQKVKGFFFVVDTITNESLLQFCKTKNIKPTDIYDVATFGIIFSNTMYTLGIPLSDTFTLKEGFKYMTKNVDESNFRTFNTLVQLVLYLSAVNADIEQDPEQKEIRERAEKKESENHNTKQANSEQTEYKEVRYKDLKKWNVGYRYGAAVKKARQQERKNQRTEQGSAQQTEPNKKGSHSRKRTHARRGHFHHFWTGSRESADRQLVLKWVSPVIVNAEYENIVTIRKVKS